MINSAVITPIMNASRIPKMNDRVSMALLSKSNQQTKTIGRITIAAIIKPCFLID